MAQARLVIDVAELDPSQEAFSRISGASGRGSFGVPVAGPGDVDGDGYADVAVAYMRADPLGRSNAGEVDLVFGNGQFGEAFDTAVDQPRLLRIYGVQSQESAGNEIWMDDVTGDGLTDVLIGRQNFSPDQDRIGAGALTVIVGSRALRDLSSRATPLDLQDPPDSVAVFTLVGREQGDRMGIWMRTGDVDGDQVADIVVGADQEDGLGNCNNCVNSGAAYLIRGGNHLQATLQVDLAALAGSPLEGHIARLHPGPESNRFHLGATCFIADLDGNGRSEVFVAAALNRAGAAINPAGSPGLAEATGGAPGGAVFIAWDDLFPAQLWPSNFDLDLNQLGGSGTIVRGGAENIIFGEEILAGADFDDDGQAELFVGDFQADPGGSRPLSGVGYVFYSAAVLKGVESDVDNLPEGLSLTRILGPSSFAIGADTAAQGDFNGDGISDLAVGNPHDDPQGRNSAGSIHLLLGQTERWPAVISTVPGQLPSPAETAVTEIQGARGAFGADAGDTLCYSASAGDVDGDGIDDLLTNEMLGNGLQAGTTDVGNLLLISGRLLTQSYTTLFAQFGNGEGFTSTVVLTNPSDNITASGQIRATGDDGGALPLEMSTPLGAGPAGASEAAFEIPPLGVLSLSTDGMGPLVAGAVRVTSNRPLGGVIRFQVPEIGIAGVGNSQPLPAFIVPARRTAGGLDTGVALFNPSAEPVRIQLTLQDAGGNPVPGGEAELELPPSGHLARFFPELFPEVVIGEFVGTLVARAQGGMVAAVALELGRLPGQFTTLPVTPLP